MSRSQWLLLIALSVLWGGSFLFVGIAVKELPTLTIVLVRVALAATCLMPVVLLAGLGLPRTLAGWAPFAAMAILNNVIPFTLIAAGQREIASGLASVLNATTPLFTVLVVWALTTDGPLARNKLAGVLIGIAGVAVLIGPEAIFGSSSSVLGMACVLGGALSYGFSGLWGRRFKGTPPLVSAACQLACSTVLLAPLALTIDRPWTLPPPTPATMQAMIGLAVLSTALAYILFFRIMAVSGPLNAMLVTLLIPVSGIALGHLVLNEPIVARHLLGATVIGLSLLLIDGRILRLLRPAGA